MGSSMYEKLVQIAKEQAERDATKAASAKVHKGPGQILLYDGKELMYKGHVVPAKTWATFKAGPKDVVYAFKVTDKAYSAIHMADGMNAVLAYTFGKPEAEMLMWVHAKVREVSV